MKALALLLAAALGLAIPAAADTRKVEVLALGFQDEPAGALDPSEQNAQFFTGANSLAAVFNRVSYGKLQVTGAVYPAPVQLPITKPIWGDADDPLPPSLLWMSGQCNAGKILAALDAQNLPLPADTTNRWLLTDCYDQASGGAAFGGEYPHEFGHLLGLRHSNLLRCYVKDGQAWKPVTLGNWTNTQAQCQRQTSCESYCTSQEYGDPYDMMGMTNTADLMAWHRNKLGWLPDANVADVTGPASYTLAPVQDAAAQTQLLRVPVFNLGGTLFLTVEYRAPQADDGASYASVGQWGLQARIVNWTATGNPGQVTSDTQLLYTDPARGKLTASPGETITVPLGPGGEPIGFTLVSTSPAGAFVSVSFGTQTVSVPPPPPAPSCPAAPSDLSVRAVDVAQAAASWTPPALAQTQALYVSDSQPAVASACGTGSCLLKQEGLAPVVSQSAAFPASTGQTYYARLVVSAPGCAPREATAQLVMPRLVAFHADVAEGARAFTVKAFDASGNSSRQDYSFTALPAAAALQSPAQGAVVSGGASFVEASACDAASAELYDGEQKLGTMTPSGSR